LPVSFRRVRISGFKSFAEPANVEILPGLTGIVGPNGCGKSNVVEALRWAMGESSARSLRGGEMEEVIFAGTSGRASRNIAEVTLFLDDAIGRAPPPFHEQPDLEVVRRIERDVGSSYRINGKDARARDVQTLFADLATGAKVSAMVSQGRVGALVNAKPEDRRAVLEEAANITGLHARRHEAELKLRAAEANLTRAEDLRGQLETQLGGLQRQARQASRFRNLSVTIRAAEAELLSLQRARAEQARAHAAATLHDAQREAATAAEGAIAAAAAAAEASDALPPLREQEASARTLLERHRIRREQIDAEEQQADAALAESRRRLEQSTLDLDHARQLQRGAAAADQRLAAEASELAQADLGHETKAAGAEATAEAAAEQVRNMEAAANRATELAAEAGARAQAAAQLLAQAEQRTSRLEKQFQNLTQERARTAAEQVHPTVIEKAENAVAQSKTATTASCMAVDQAEQGRPTAAATLASTRDAHAAADTARARLAAEAQALAEILAVKDGERWPPLVDSLTVADGLEAALGAVLGDELTSALNPNAARHWRALPTFDPAPALPPCCEELSAFVQGPPALARVLSQIGLVANEQDGAAHQTTLLPGQSLVARSGAIWRWDGYTIRAGTATQATVRLQQRNRLAGLRTKLVAAERVCAAAQAEQKAAETAALAAATAEQEARAAWRDHEQRLDQARTDLASLRNRAVTAAARLAAADDQLVRITAERDEAMAGLAQLRRDNGSLPETAALRAEVDRLRATLSAERGYETAARAARDLLARDHAARVTRHRAIVAERAGWAERAHDAAARVTDLVARQSQAEEALAALAANPGKAAARKAEALEAFNAAEAAHRHLAEVMSAALARSAQAERHARAAERVSIARREDVIRAEAGLEHANHAWGVVAEHVPERLSARTPLPDPPTDLSPESEDRARKRLERLCKEREEMGPVNLRAEQEVEALETQIRTIETEREELATAIAKLRGSIGHLNRESRERLTAVFQEVDRNFQQLFSRMFGGGRAHLSLVGSDDPLLAGLEIYVQPPGKKFASLSLLSGGEQALTALSLIFAVFRCNPAPVCVLDEVDAPLDDANVDRFCTLLDDMVRETGTRFLVVTHHPLTMTRMDRLYGVTMQERGVSRVLSVDLASAAGMIDPPRLAAE